MKDVYNLEIVDEFGYLILTVLRVIVHVKRQNNLKTKLSSKLLNYYY